MLPSRPQHSSSPFQLPELYQPRPLKPVTNPDGLGARPLSTPLVAFPGLDSGPYSTYNEQRYPLYTQDSGADPWSHPRFSIHEGTAYPKRASTAGILNGTTTRLNTSFTTFGAPGGRVMENIHDHDGGYLNSSSSVDASSNITRESLVPNERTTMSYWQNTDISGSDQVPPWIDPTTWPQFESSTTASLSRPSSVPTVETYLAGLLALLEPPDLGSEKRPSSTASFADAPISTSNNPIKTLCTLPQETNGASLSKYGKPTDPVPQPQAHVSETLLGSNIPISSSHQYSMNTSSVPDSHLEAWATILQWSLSMQLHQLNAIAQKRIRAGLRHPTYAGILEKALTAVEGDAWSQAFAERKVNPRFLQEMNGIPGCDLKSHPYTFADVNTSELKECMVVVGMDPRMLEPGYPIRSQLQSSNTAETQSKDVKPSIPLITISHAPNTSGRAPTPHPLQVASESSKQRGSRPSIATPGRRTKDTSPSPRRLSTGSRRVAKIAQLVQDVYFHRGLNNCEGEASLSAPRRAMHAPAPPCPLVDAAPDVRSQAARTHVMKIIKSSIEELQADARKVAGRRYDIDDKTQKLLLSEPSTKITETLYDSNDDLDTFIREHLRRCPQVTQRAKERKALRDRLPSKSGRTSGASKPANSPQGDRGQRTI